MKYFLTLLLLLSNATTAFAESLNLTLPPSSGNYQSDSIRAGDLDCKNAIGGSVNFEVGVMGIINQNSSYSESISTDYSMDDTTGAFKDVGVYAKITIPLDGPKERINCNTLYQLELTKKRLEVRRLEEELRQLRALKFEN